MLVKGLLTLFILFSPSKLNCSASVVSRAIIAISAQLVKTVITSGKDLNERAKVDVCGSLRGCFFFFYWRKYKVLRRNNTVGEKNKWICLVHSCYVTQAV